MKKSILVFCAIILFAGCSKEQNYVEVLNSEISLADARKEIQFSTTLTHVPTIKHKLGNEELFFAVDSASGNYLLGTKLVKKIVPGDLYQAAKKVKQTSSYRMSFTSDNMVFFLDPNYIFSAVLKKSPYDGFLGLPYLEQYRNVVFDYQKKTIAFNQEAICDNELPMYKKDGWWYTTMECNGVTTNALVDTGCFSVFVNKPNVRVTIREAEIISVKLGTVEFNDISIAANKTLITNEDAKNGIYSNENIIGYPCFKDHVIQLDFEHNKFRIK